MFFFLPRVRQDKAGGAWCPKDMIGKEGKEWKHFGGSLKGNDGARDAGNLKYPTTGDLRIVRVVGKVTVRATCLE